MNLAAQNPEIVSRLSAKLTGWVATLPKAYLKTTDRED